jgi:hypothetical protein
VAESYNQDSSPKKPGRAGCPPLLERNPNLSSAIVYRFGNNESMRQVAEELGIGLTTLRGWKREGKKQSSGPLHEIALAIEQSKLRRGIGAKRVENPTSWPNSAQPNLRMARVVGTPEKWSSIGLRPHDGESINLDSLINRCMSVAPEAAKHLLKAESTSSDRASRANPLTATQDVPQLEVVKAAYNEKVGWQEFPIADAIVESLYQNCDSTARDKNAFVKTEHRWPRNIASLSEEQKFVIHKKAWIMAKIPDRGLVQMYFVAHPVY